MSKVEKGVISGKNDGKEPMGLPAAMKKKKQRKEVDLQREEVGTKPERDAGHRPTANGGRIRKKASSRQAYKTGSESEPQALQTQNPEAKSAASKGTSPYSATSRPAPAELLLPHTIAGSKAEPRGGVDEDGMTHMQKGMKAKLEGARFRWINEQLYSTPSTGAVAMMKKDPKIFSDVSDSTCYFQVGG